MDPLELSHSLMRTVVSQDTEELCRLIKRVCLPNTVQRWFFYLWQKSSEEFYLAFPCSNGSDHEIPDGCRRLLEKGEPLVDNELFRLGEQWPGTETYPVALWLPLFHDSQPVGAIQGLTDLDPEAAEQVLEQLKPLSSLIAGSFHLLTLLNEKDELAFVDSLTGLYNAQFLTKFLENEIKRCKRYGRSLSVIFIDIDFFKTVNDAHGHLFGSSTLTEVAAVLQDGVRDSDLISRFGGDEYVVVTRNLGLEAGCLVAERLLEGIRRHVFGTDKGKTIRLTISAGVASYPGHGGSAHELIHLADQAMYKAKADRGNCVRTAV